MLLFGPEEPAESARIMLQQDFTTVVSIREIHSSSRSVSQHFGYIAVARFSARDSQIRGAHISTLRHIGYFLNSEMVRVVTDYQHLGDNGNGYMRIVDDGFKPSSTVPSFTSRRQRRP